MVERAAQPLHEWLEADALGGFAMGTATGVRTRRYHALLTPATEPPAGRVVSVAAVEAWLETSEGCWPLSSHRYGDDTIHPRGVDLIESFATEPWPTWCYRPAPSMTVQHEIVCETSTGDVVLRWRVEGAPAGAKLRVRPLLAGRDYHALQRENGAFDFRPTIVGANAAWRPYEGRPGVSALTNGTYDHEPEWYRNFVYDREVERGLDHVEDLASPGQWTFDCQSDAVIVFRAGDAPFGDGVTIADRHRASERARRAAFASSIERAADAYVVKRGRGHTLVAGFPWFTDWGRDTFIAIRGICLATGRLEEAASVLDEWAGAVSEGMLPNRFPDAGDLPEYNSVDASLFFVVAVGELLDLHPGLSASRRGRLRDAAVAILDGYRRGTRFGIRCAPDGLIAAGEPGVQLTWMDAKVGDWVVTPRTGKAVEIQALWVNALEVGARWETTWARLAEQARTSFLKRFRSPSGGLYDLVDVDHVDGRVDASVRPNQIFAVGGLPSPLLSGKEARSVVDLVEEQLLTPVGLRSLSPDDPSYVGTYAGGPLERDGAYHQGTAWPWLIGPFVEAWLRVRRDTPEARAEARRRFVRPFEAHLAHAGLGHVSEIADGDAPHRPKGAPFQAWSIAELVRAEQMTRTPKATAVSSVVDNRARACQTNDPDTDRKVS